MLLVAKNIISDSNLFFYLYNFSQSTTFEYNSHFYNPLFYISGFKLYKIKTKDGFESVIYSKKEIVTGISLKNWNIHRINKFTYIAYTK